MNALRIPFAVLTLAVAGLPAMRARAQDAPSATASVAVATGVVHPGSELAVSVTPAAGVPDEPMVVVGMVEADRRIVVPLRALGSARRSREPNAPREVVVTVSVPVEAKKGTLRFAATGASRAKTIPAGASVADVESVVGPMASLPIVPAPNLAMVAVEINGARPAGGPSIGLNGAQVAVKLGEPIVARWTVQRTELGDVGPAFVRVRMVPGSVRNPRREQLGDPSPVRVEASGVATGEATVTPVPNRAGRWTLFATVSYAGVVAPTDRDDETRVVVEVEDPALAPPSPAPQPPGPGPSPSPPQPPTPTPPPAPAPQPEPAPPDDATASFVVSVPQPPQSPVDAGTVIGVAYEVRNPGTRRAPAASIVLHLVTAQGSRVIDAEPLSLLAPGGVKRGRLRAELPVDATGRMKFRVGVVRQRAVEPAPGESVDVEIDVRAALANLLITGVGAEPNEVAVGGTVRLSAVVRNAGTGTSSRSRVAFWAMRTRPNATLDLGTFDVPALRAGEERRIDAVVTIPPGTAIARWALGAKADAGDVVPESDENDNVAMVPGGLTTLEPAPAEPDVDLFVRDVTVDGGADVDPGAPVRARVRVANAGRSAAPAFDVAVFLSTRERPEWRRDGWRGVVSEIARVTVPAGTAGASETVRVLEGRMPPGLAPGTYHLFVLADPSGVIVEKKGPGDAATTPIRLRGRAVLAASGDDALRIAPDRVAAGGTATATLAVVNRGNARAQDATVTLLVVGQGRAGRGVADIPVGPPQSLDAIEAGAGHVLTFDVRVPERAPRGPQRVRAVLSTPGVEPVELASGWLTVGAREAGIDLAISGARVEPSRARSGEGVRVHARVSNVGEGRAPATLVEVAIDDGRDTHGVGHADVPALDRGRSADVSVVFRVPRALPATPLTLRVRVDPTQANRDSNRANDEAWTTVEIVGRTGRDVRLGWRSPSRAGTDRVTRGGPIDFRGRVENQGDEPVDSTDVEVVLVLPSGEVRSLGRRPLGAALGQGGGVDWSERFVLPQDLEPGRYVARLLLDPDHRLPWAEGDEQRAIAEISIDVEAGADTGTDLAIVSVEHERGLRPQPRRLAIGAMVANRGPGVAPAFDVTLYLASRDADRDGLWLPLSTRSFHGGLIAAGSQTRAAFAVDVPDEIPAGEYRAVVIADAESRVDVARRGDNQGHVLVRVDEREPAPTPIPSTPIPTAPVPSGEADLVLVELKPLGVARAGATATLRTRVTTKRAGTTSRAFRWVVFLRNADGSFRELFTSGPEQAPSVGAHAVGTLAVPVPADARVSMMLRIEARPENGDVVPDDNSADVGVTIDDSPAPTRTAPAVGDTGLPLPVAWSVAGGALTREQVNAATVTLSYVADAAAGSILDVTLETAGASWPLGEFDVPAGFAATSGAVKMRLRVPSSAAAGAATLVLVVRDEAGRSRAPVRAPVVVR